MDSRTVRARPMMLSNGTDFNGDAWVTTPHPTTATSNIDAKLRSPLSQHTHLMHQGGQGTNSPENKAPTTLFVWGANA